MMMHGRSTVFIGNAKVLLTGYPLVIIVLIFASAIAVLPHMVAGFPNGHSVLWNVPWQRYFTEQLLAGELYPRWLFNYLDGFGAPVFYFYAPIPFYVLSFIEVIFGKDGGGFGVFTVGHMTIFFLSGIAFFIFISRFVNNYWATVTSILYIFLPYHYIDLEVRAALGESFAYIWIPLIMIGLCSSKRTWTHLFFSGFCYAGLILSHLPSALLVAPIIAIFSLCVTNSSRWLPAIGNAFFIGIMGTVLSAFYILPAILLRDTLTYDAWVTGSGRHFQAVNWLLGNPKIHPFGIQVYIALASTSLVGVGAALGFGAVFSMKKRRIKVDEKIWRLITASLLSLCACWLLMSVVSRPVWEHFPLIQVQFPWRLGIIIDFCSIFLIAIVAPHVLAYFLSLVSLKGETIATITHGVIVAISLTTVVLYFPQTTVSSTEGPEANPLEYRTKWLVESAIYLSARNVNDLTDIDLAPGLHDDGIQRWRSFVKALPPISALRVLEPPTEAVTFDEKKIGVASISVIIKSPATIRLRKVYFPHWQLKNDSGASIDIYPDAQTGLLLFKLPPGDHKLILERRMLPSEQAGLTISLVSLILSVVLVAAFGHRKIFTRMTT